MSSVTLPTHTQSLCTAVCQPATDPCPLHLTHSTLVGSRSLHTALSGTVAGVRDTGSVPSPQVKHRRTTLPLWILTTALQMPSPKTTVVSSPHTTATSVLRSHARQEAMGTQTKDPLLGENDWLLFFSRWEI